MTEKATSAPMTGAILDTRRRALENAFFIEEDRRLTRRLVEASAEQAERERITAITGIADPAVIDQFIALGLRGPALAALTLAPLVLVAWADGDVGDAERDAVMDVAAEVGQKPGSEAHDLLGDWLMQPPPASLLSTWEAYAKHLTGELDADARSALHKEVMVRARAVAEAQGGFLRIGRISSAEAGMLGHIDTVLS
jgi:uncharacterized tellurite resistance protein B-like protein